MDIKDKDREALNSFAMGLFLYHLVSAIWLTNYSVWRHAVEFLLSIIILVVFRAVAKPLVRKSLSRMSRRQKEKLQLKAAVAEGVAKEISGKGWYIQSAEIEGNIITLGLTSSENYQLTQRICFPPWHPDYGKIFEVAHHRSFLRFQYTEETPVYQEADKTEKSFYLRLATSVSRMWGTKAPH
jgi:hypothetical protein